MQNRTDRNRLTPTDTIVADIVSQLDADLREDFEERAGIIEYDAKKARDHAECLALLDVIWRHPSVLSGVTVLEIELDGATQWLLTTDLDCARQHISDIGAFEISVLNPAAVVMEKYGGVAMLATVR